MAVTNRRMREKVASGEAIDLSKNPQLLDLGKLARELTDVVEGMDYCILSDADDPDTTDEWIWSIGRREIDGRILASTDARYYQRPGYECLFLR